MKTTSIPFVMTAVMGIAAAAGGQADKSSAPAPRLPTLKAGIQIRAANQVLTVGHTASPEVLDWNNDGKQDLLVGTFSAGKVFLFLNRGTDALPLFDQGRPVKAGGQDVSVGFG